MNFTDGATTAHEMILSLCTCRDAAARRRWLGLSTQGGATAERICPIPFGLQLGDNLDKI